MNIKILQISIVIVFAVMLSFPIKDTDGQNKINFRNEMRNLVALISSRAKKIKPDFIVVPQNAMELITKSGEPGGDTAQAYLSSIDGTGCEELFYGHIKDGVPTPKDTRDYFLNYLLRLKKLKKTVLVIDYVMNKKQAEDSYALCLKYGFISFQASRALSQIPEWIFNDNDSDVSDISGAKNFLYLLNASKFRTPDAYIRALEKTKNDLIVIDAFFWERMLSKAQVNLLQKKPSGKRRLVMAYLSIGEAEDYRYYWKPEWKRNPPEFLERENKEWKGNYKVKYWTEEWKEIICGRLDGTGFESSYLKKIMDAGFDGVYLDVLDAAYYFEKKYK